MTNTQNADWLDDCLKRLLADIDDSMEFFGTDFGSRTNVEGKIKTSLAKAKQTILKHIEEHEQKTPPAITHEDKYVPVNLLAEPLRNIEATNNRKLRAALAELEEQNPPQAHYLHVHAPCDKCGGCIYECEHRVKAAITTTTQDLEHHAIFTPDFSITGDIRLTYEYLRNRLTDAAMPVERTSQETRSTGGLDQYAVMAWVPTDDDPNGKQVLQEVVQLEVAQKVIAQTAKAYGGCTNCRLCKEHHDGME